MRKFFQFIKSESAEFRTPLIVMAVLAGTINGFAISVAIGTAKKLQPGVINFRELLLFALCLFTFWLTKQHVLNRTTTIVEGIVRDVRLRIIRKIRDAPLLTFESMDEGRIYSTLSTDATVISVSSGAIINATSAVVMLAFVVGYIGFLSIAALAITAFFITTAVVLYLRRSRTVGEEMREASIRENEFFDNLKGLLRAFKDFKLNRHKSDDFFGRELANLVSSTADLRVKSGKTMNQAVLLGQTFLFFTVGGVLFLLPNVDPPSFSVVVPVIAVVLFAAGPIGDVVVAIPALAKAQASIDNIAALEAEVDNARNHDERLAAEADLQPISFASLECRDCAFQYPVNGSSRPFALKPFDFHLKRGEIVFVVGGNGSGKSTFLKLMTALYAPSQGEIRFNGERLIPGLVSTYRDIFSTIFTDFYLFRRVPGLREVERPLIDGLLRKLELTGITDIQDGCVTNLNLSTGQKKRLALILSYLDDKPVCVFDEWAADQDPVFRKTFYEVLLPEMRAQGKAVVAVTHDDHYFHTADRIYKMDEGAFVPGERHARAFGS